MVQFRLERVNSMNLLYFFIKKCICKKKNYAKRKKLEKIVNNVRVRLLYVFKQQFLVTLKIRVSKKVCRNTCNVN